MSTGRRLFKYAMTQKLLLSVALSMLIISVGADLMRPLIIKQIIDEHIIGIEQVWTEVAKEDSEVEYRGHYYQKGDVGEGNKIEIVQDSGTYYATSSDDVMSSDENVVLLLEEDRLSKDELYQFGKSQFPAILVLGLKYIALFLIAAVFAYGQKYYLEYTSNKIIQRMREDVFAHTQRIPIKYFDSLPAGKIVSRVTNDTEAIRELYVTVLATFCSGIIQITGILIMLFYLDRTLGLICTIVIPILYIWIVVYRKLATKYNHEIRSRLSDINGMMNESISGMSIIQIFRQEKRTSAEFEVMNEDYYHNQKKLLHLNASTSHNLVGTLRLISFITLIWYFGGQSLVSDSVITVGVLYAFVDYLNKLFQPMTGMVNQLANLEAAMVSSERLFELMDEDGEDVSEKRIAKFDGNVSFQNVSLQYNEKDTVLKDISFEVNKGETFALVGHTGSGKSSIMNVLFGFYPFQKGKITIDGMDIMNVKKQEYREHMGIVLQDPFLFTGTIASNISLDNPNITREKIEECIKAVGAEFIYQLPNVLDEPVFEKGNTFSTGERQLISFARALAFDPAILILDEATASIDTETEGIIQEALEVLKKGRTTFMIAHRLSTIRNADKIVVLDRGEIVERGNHDELMKEKGKYFNMYELQLKGTL